MSEVESSRMRRGAAAELERARVRESEGGRESEREWGARERERVWTFDRDRPRTGAPTKLVTLR